MENVKILAVEDDLIIAESLRMMLSNLNYEVIGVARSYKEGINFLETTEPDLVLLDIVLSDEKSGIDLARTIRAEYDLPFIFTTSHAGKEIVDMAKHTKPNGYLVKPFEQDDLYTAVEVALFNYMTLRKLRVQEKNQQQNIIDEEAPVFTKITPSEETDLTEKYQKSALTGDQKLLLKKQVLQLFDDKNPYLRHDYRITDLAVDLNTNKGYLSQMINEEFSLNFYNFINQYRIEEAKDLLLNNNYYSIQGIAENSGFKSISSFNTAFKKTTGMSPSVFRKNLPENE